MTEQPQAHDDFCPEHSAQRVLLKALLGLVGTAVVLLLFQIGLTLKMNDSLKSDLALLRERIAVLEYRVNEVVQSRRVHGG